MSRLIASFIFVFGIAGLFFLDRDKKTRGSKALWIPIAWLLFCSSRSLSEWLGLTAATGQASVYLDGSPADRALFTVLEILALIVVISRRRRVGPILRRNWAMGFFFVYAALSISWSDFPLVAGKHWIKAIGDLLMIAIVLTEASVTEAIKRVVTRLGFVLLPLSILFIRYYPLLGRRVTNSWTMEAVGVCTQKNGLGILCDYFGLALLWRFRSAFNDRKDPNRKRRLVALGVVLGMVGWLLRACNSLTSMCALSMGVAVMFLSGRPAFRRKPALINLLVIGLLAISAYALFFQSSGGLVESLGRDSTLSGRTMGWSVMLSIPNNRLVGTGYDSFWLGPRLQQVWDTIENSWIGQAHNGYLEIFLNLGWIGVGALALLIVTGYRNVIHAWRRDPDSGGLRLAYFLAVLVNGYTEGIFRMMTPPWIFFLLATAAAPWVMQQKLPGRVASSWDILESGQKSDAVRDGAACG